MTAATAERHTSSRDIVAVGLNATDTLIRVPHFPAFDSKTKILSSSLLAGGQAATAAVACQRWGLRSRYVGKIGDDAAGRLQREELAREGVEARLIEVPNCASQVAYILVDQSTGERTILWQRDDRLDLQVLRNCRWTGSEMHDLLHVDGHPCAPGGRSGALGARCRRDRHGGPGQSLSRS